MLVNICHSPVHLYADTHPHGTYTGIDIETPSKAPESTAGGFSASQVIEVREVQLKKAAYPMLVTLLGIVTEVKEEQLEKASSPMPVTLLGIVIEVREEQLWKVPVPILVILSGITIEVREEQPKKA